MRPLRDVYDAQAGVVSRRQLLDLGASDNDIRRLVRRRELVRVHTGVYVNHTGPLSWVSRAWAAILFHGGSEVAALCDVSALDLAGHPIHVAVEWPRNGTGLPGVRLHRPMLLGDRVLWHLQPPRLRVEEAALDVAGAASRLSDAVAVLTGVCQRRRTTPDRLLQALERRSRTPRGTELVRVIGDIAFGIDSVLERSYAQRVERRHGLPRGQRQRRDLVGGGVVYRDVLYEPFGVLVELDGQAWHGQAAERWADMTRDLEAAAEGLLTIRLGWQHAHDEACRTALRLSDVLRRRGWSGSARSCGAACPLSGRSRAWGA